MTNKKHNEKQNTYTNGKFKPKKQRILDYNNAKFKYLNKYFKELIDNDEFLGRKVDNAFKTANWLLKVNKITDDDSDNLSNDICNVIELVILIISECPYIKIII